MRVLALLLPLLVQPGQGRPAFAHAVLLDAVPQDGTVLPAGPGEVRLRFNEPVRPVSLSLVGPGGPVPPLEPATAAGDVLRARFPAALPPGTYLLSWRVTSADSHPVVGTTAFGIGAPPVPHPQAEPAQRWLPASITVRWLFLFALLAAAGGALFHLVAPVPPAVRPLLAAAAWSGAALAALQVGLRGALLADAPTLLAAGPWALGLRTALAPGLGVSALGLLGTLARGRVAAAFGALALSGLALSGHAATAEPQALLRPALLLHVGAAAVWVGAFWPLLVLLRGGDALPALRRFSARAVPAVALLLLSGTALAAVQLGGPARLVAGLGTPYGTVLLFKLAGVAVLLALAGWNRLRLTRAAAAGRPGPLRVSIRAELAVAAAVLAATAALGLLPPPRAARPVDAAAAAPPPGLAVWTQSGPIGALIELDPARPGSNTVSVTLDRPQPPREVWLELRHPRAGVAALRRPMRPDAGRWTWSGPEMAVPGRWTLRVEVLLNDFEQTTFTTEADLP